jgi:hypothetical protein
MGFVKLIIGLPLFVLLLLFAIVNNDFVTLKIWPTDIEIITSLPEDLLITYANQSDVVAKRFSTEVWNETMKRIEELNG